MSDDVKLEMRFTEWSMRMRRQVDAGLEAAAEDVAMEWGSNVPVETGAYQDSITFEKTGEMEYTVHDGEEYGVYLELGTHKLGARPDLTYAMLHEETRFAQRFQGMDS